MNKTMILGIMVYDRIKEAGNTQRVLSTHAPIISTRLGFHELSTEVCSRTGFILLVLNGSPEQNKLLTDDLALIRGIEVQIMQFQKGYST